MEKRYQVFVSSTYEDLQNERMQVLEGLLAFNCIPAGMEYFPASGGEKWDLIREQIEASDYYIVIIGNRYGSVDDDGVGWTEREYLYARDEAKIPVLAFVHGDPGALPSKYLDASTEAQGRLRAFRETCKQKMCKIWTDSRVLLGLVCTSISNEIKKRPGIGYVRGDLVPSDNSMHKLLEQNDKIQELEKQLAAAQTAPPPGAVNLQSDEDVIILRYKFRFYADHSMHEWDSTRELSWNAIFARVAPLLLEEANEDRIRGYINNWLTEIIQSDPECPTNISRAGSACNIADFHQILIQLRAIGLIGSGTKKRPAKDSDKKYWKLTPYGDLRMVQLLALRKQGSEASA